MKTGAGVTGNMLAVSLGTKDAGVGLLGGAVVGAGVPGAGAAVAATAPTPEFPKCEGSPTVLADADDSAGVLI